MVGLMALLLVTYTFHCTWVTSEAYSSPSIVLSAKQHDGSRVIFDDFREAYYWLRQNTPEVTWSWYFATRMLLRGKAIVEVSACFMNDFCCRCFFGGGGGGWNNATASIHCSVKKERESGRMGLNLTSCAQFAVLSLVKSVVTRLRLRHCWHVVFDESTHLLKLNRRAWSRKMIFIFICLFQESKVMSWWDYGYQITAMANRTILVDNNTWNNTHISRVGQVRQHVINTCFSL